LPERMFMHGFRKKAWLWLTYWPRRLRARWSGCLVVSDDFDVDEYLDEKERRETRWARWNEGYLVVRDEKTPWEAAVEALDW